MAIRLLACACVLFADTALALDSVCARVKIQIDQKLTLERQGFDAMMRITNALDTVELKQVRVDVLFTDEAGAPVRATSDPTDTSASFFIRVDTVAGISDVNGTGTVAPISVAEVHWLIVPSPGAGGTLPGGKLYFVGANLSYTVGGEAQTLKVSPDTVTVQPMPRLTLDYFLTKDVFADDPFTPEVEPPVPFTLGVRVRNGGAATARHVRIESAQPKIVENLQGLLVGFQITGSYVNDSPTSPSLLTELGDIAPSSASTGRWVMTSTLSGKFVEFKASFTHSDALGGALTSLIDATRAHLLVRDVKVDLPGRDSVRDFLARDDDVLRLYESTGVDTPVTEQSGSSSLTPSGGATYLLSAPQTSGFLYVKLPDPSGGTKQLGTVTRSDGKVIPPENVWLSRSRATPGGPFSFWINLFDANTPGTYTLVLTDPAATPRPPVLSLIPDRAVREGEQVAFLVEASDPDGTIPSLTTSQLPSGARFTPQAPLEGVARGSFEWTPATGQAGQYPITFTASDGSLSAARTSTVTVTPLAPPPGPDTPVISRPAVASTVTALQPELAVAKTSNPLDTAASYQFELYRDASYTDRIAQSPAVPRSSLGAAWQVPAPLADNATYHWRVRAFDGTTYSTWTLGRFTVNTVNDAPSIPAIAAPAPGGRVDTPSPTLSISNSTDPDGEPVVYRFEVYADAALSQKLRELSNIAAGSGGVTSVAVAPPLADQTTYHWRVFAIDPHGAITASPAASFSVDVSHPAPEVPAILSPIVGTVVTSASVPLRVANGAHGPGVASSYFFELDRDRGFTSPAVVRSGAVPEGQGETRFTVTGLAENTRYFWRAKSSDGVAESAWVYGDFLVDQANDPPGVPALLNPGQGAFVSTREPLLEIGASSDPDDVVVVYHLEIYSDEALSGRVAEQLTDTLTWVVQPPLADEATYFWRVRAEDTRGGASVWSAVQRFSVHTGTVRPPGLVLVEPSGVVTVTGPTVPIAWEIDDPTHASTLALFSDRDAQGEDGTLIVRDLAQDPASTTGRYLWNVSTLLPGTYYVYASATNRAGTTTRYAAGAYVIPVAQPRGGFTLTPTTALETTEAGGTATFTVALTTAPRSEVTLGFTVSQPNEARLAPSSLTFTPTNWNVPRAVTVTGLPDCVDDGDQPYQVVPGRATSADPDYNGIQAAPLAFVNRGSTSGCLENQAPQAHAGPDQTVDAGSTVVLAGSGTDVDGTVAAYHWVQTAGPAVTLSDASVAAPGFTAPLPAADTVLGFELTVTDNEGATGRDSVAVTVRARPNQPPVADAGPDQTVTAGESVTLAGSGTDVDGTIVSYAWAQVSGPAVTLSGATTATATFSAPVVSAPVSLGFTLRVTDDRGASATAPVTVTVQPIPNEPPTVDAGANQSVLSGTPVTLVGSATDPDGTVVAFLWTQMAGPPVTLLDASTATARFTAPAVSANTVLTFQLTATDDQGASASDPVSITVVPNQLPVVKAGADQVVNERMGVTLAGAVSDADGTIVSVQWTQTAGPAVTLTNANLLTAYFTTPAVSTDTVLTFTLTAIDNLGASGSATTHVTVHHVNQPPTANAGPAQTVNENTQVTLSGAGFDPDGSIVSYAWVQTTGVPVALMNAGTAVATFTSPQVNSPATLTFDLTVTDNEGATGTARVTVRVRDNLQNVPPSVSAGPSQTVDEGTPVTLTGSATDFGGTITSLQWTQTEGPVVTLSGAQSAVARFTAPQVSAQTVLKFQLRATDNEGASTSASTEVVVRDVPTGPVVDAGPDLTVNEGQRVTVRGSASPSGLSYQWALISGPAVSLSGATTAVVSFTAPAVTADSVLTLKLTVRGWTGVTASDTVNITIRNVNQPPVAVVEQVGSVNERTLVTLRGSGSRDPDGSIRSYLWVQTAGPPVALSNPRGASTSFTAPEVTLETMLSFRLTVTDNEGATGSAVVIVTVRDVRRL
ncbi:PKD domain-containing protein [Archangium sp.]|uniref:PKD domain-containing protein n=1 Tax=Archangium sp. TaxID=1872627 RepID=UPI00389AC24F